MNARLGTIDVAERYRRQFNLEPDRPVTLAMMEQHFALERDARSELLASPPEQRAAIAERWYDRLYGECKWLAELPPVNRLSVEADLGWWRSLLAPHSSILEIGSGPGKLARFLAAEGHSVTATEITLERGDRAPQPNIVWPGTDGVHLSQLGKASYDAVISYQLLEHLHPDDVPVHIAEAFQALRPGGRLIFGTPQRMVGPADVSAAFGYVDPAGMHLREWTYGELVPILQGAGFAELRSVLIVPARLRHIMNGAWCSQLHLTWSKFLERRLAPLPGEQRARAARACRYLGLRADVMLAARKPARR